MEKSTRPTRVAKTDRLSNLPDEILCHILSFVPTKLSVATSILARRWRFLWTHVLNLDFDGGELTPKRDFGMGVADIISRVLMLRSNVRDINTFRLLVNDESYVLGYHLDTWIRSAIARNVHALDIKLDYQVFLPHCVFTCETLVSLRLDGCGNIPNPDGIFLPNLKKLHLHSILYQNDKELEGLMSQCPVLEEVNIQKIGEVDLERFVISSPTIKCLTLNFDLDSWEEEYYNFKLVINTPALRYLNVEDNLSGGISTGTFNSLVEASIVLNSGSDEVTDDVFYSNSVLEFIQKVCQVKCLKLSSAYSKFLESSFAAATSKFINLTKLELAIDWRFLFKFLESADNLQVLIIGEVDDGLINWMEPQQIPMCLSSHLRQVTVDSFGYSESEFEMIRYIMRNGNVLNMMDIISTDNSDLGKKFVALQKISAFEREKTCKLQFS